MSVSKIAQLAIGIAAMLSVTNCALAQDQNETFSTELCDAWASESNQDDAYALRNLAYCYWTGQGRPKDLSVAEGLLRQSSALGNATAMYNLGTILVFEDEDESNDEEGINLLEAAIDGGYKATMDRHSPGTDKGCSALHCLQTLSVRFSSRDRKTPGSSKPQVRDLLLWCSGN